MQKIEIIDEYGVSSFHQKNDDIADLFVEESMASGEYGPPDRISIIRTILLDEEVEGIVRECGETLHRREPVYIDGYRQLRKAYPTTENLFRDFDGKLFASCRLYDRTIAVAHTNLEDGLISIRSGYAHEEEPRVAWEEPTLLEMGTFTEMDMCAVGEGIVVLAASSGHGAGEGIIVAVRPGEGKSQVGPVTLFSTENRCKDISVANIDGVHFAVAYQDGADNCGYCKIGSINEETLEITWDHVWNYCADKNGSYENRLCSIAFDEEANGMGFAVFYRKAVGGYKCFVKTAFCNEEGNLEPGSDEILCVDSYAREVRVARLREESEVRIALAYVDVDAAGAGKVCIGDFTDIGKPVFKPQNSMVVNAGSTSALRISAHANEISETFYLSWIDHARNSALRFGNFYWIKDIPTPNTHGPIIEYWPVISSTLIGFQYRGWMDVFMLYTIDKGYGELESYNVASANKGIRDICSAIGMMNEDGEKGDMCHVKIFGDVMELEEYTINHPYYVQRDCSIASIPTPFPIACGIADRKILLTRTPVP